MMYKIVPIDENGNELPKVITSIEEENELYKFSCNEKQYVIERESLLKKLCEWLPNPPPTITFG